MLPYRRPLSHTSSSISLWLVLMSGLMRRGQAEESERVEERCGQGETQRRALTETPGAVCRFSGVPGELSADAAAA